MHALCNRVRNGRTGSFKVVDYFGTNQKGICYFLLIINNNLGPNSCTVSEIGDLLAENRKFFIPHSHLTSLLGVNPFEYLVIQNPLVKVS